MNEYEVEINLKVRNLSYKHFYSMKKYKTILNINYK